jgi:hypothetical protein
MIIENSSTGILAHCVSRLLLKLASNVAIRPSENGSVSSFTGSILPMADVPDERYRHCHCQQVIYYWTSSENQQRSSVGFQSIEKFTDRQR